MTKDIHFVLLEGIVSFIQISLNNNIISLMHAVIIQFSTLNFAESKFD